MLFKRMHIQMRLSGSYSYRKDHETVWQLIREINNAKLSYLNLVRFIALISNKYLLLWRPGSDAQYEASNNGLYYVSSVGTDTILGVKSQHIFPF